MKIRTEREYRDIIGKAVFWLVRLDMPPAIRELVDKDLIPMREILDEDIESSVEKLSGIIGERFE